MQKLPTPGGNSRWILMALITILLVAGFWMRSDGNVPEWEKCRESLFQQMFSDTCTPRRGFAAPNSNDQTSPTQ